MMIYLPILYALSLVLSYVLCWDMATRAAVRLMDDEPSITLAGKPPIGLLHALTPRWAAALAVVGAGGSVGWLGYGWWTYGAAVGMTMVVGFIAAMGVNAFVFLPRPESRHYRRLMTPPLLSRHAHLVGRGKTGKAKVLERLLERLGMPIGREQGRPIWVRA